MATASPRNLAPRVGGFRKESYTLAGPPVTHRTTARHADFCYDLTMRWRFASLLLSVLLPFVAAADQILPTGGMSRPRYWHTATRLRDGRVLVAGGRDLTTPTNTAEIYDPQTGRFTATGAMAQPRARAAATLLVDGRVLITGGTTSATVAELYDPSSGQFTPTYGPMSYPRLEHSAALLLDGRVLIVGGAPEGHRDEAELFDPSSSTFLPLPKMLTSRSTPLSFTLPNGNVLIIGGAPSTAPATEYFNTTTIRFEPAPLRTFYSQGLEAAAQLPTTDILITGGAQNPDGIGSASEIFDPGLATFIQVASLLTARRAHTAALLDNGRVFLSGGEVFTPDHTDTISTDSTELFEPSTRTFRAGPRMIKARESHTATKLPDGKILIAGGIVYPPPFQALSSAEIYKPDPPARRRAARH